MQETTVQSFWRDEALPFIDARSVDDGREVCYGKHAHAAFSIGAVTGGRSTYVNGKVLERAGPGSVVVSILTWCMPAIPRTTSLGHIACCTWMSNG